MGGHNIRDFAFEVAVIFNLVFGQEVHAFCSLFQIMDFRPPFIARRLLGFNAVFNIDDKPDFLIFPQRFWLGDIYALDTLLYRFFRIGRAERLCAGKPFLSGSAERNIFALFDFIPHFLQTAQQFVKIFDLGNEGIYRRFQLGFVACSLLFGGVFRIAFPFVLSRHDDG